MRFRAMRFMSPDGKQILNIDIGDCPLSLCGDCKVDPITKHIIMDFDSVFDMVNRWRESKGEWKPNVYTIYNLIYFAKVQPEKSYVELVSRLFDVFVDDVKEIREFGTFIEKTDDDDVFFERFDEILMKKFGFVPDYRVCGLRRKAR